MKRILRPKEIADSAGRYSQGILVDGIRGLLFISGQTATARDGSVAGVGDIEAQTRQVFQNLAAVLKEAGLGFENLVQTTTYLTDRSYREGYNRVRTEVLNKEPPTSTLLVISGLARPEFLVEIAGIAAF